MKKTSLLFCALLFAVNAQADDLLLKKKSLPLQTLPIAAVPSTDATTQPAKLPAISDANAQVVNPQTMERAKSFGLPTVQPSDGTTPFKVDPKTGKPVTKDGANVTTGVVNLNNTGLGLQPLNRTETFSVNNSKDAASWHLKPQSGPYYVRVNDMPIANSVMLDFAQSKKTVTIMPTSAGAGFVTFSIPAVVGVLKEEVVIKVKTELNTISSQTTIFEPEIETMTTDAGIEFEWRCVAQCGDLPTAFSSNKIVSNTYYGGANHYIGDWSPNAAAVLEFRPKNGKLNTANGWRMNRFDVKANTEQYSFYIDNVRYANEAREFAGLVGAGLPDALLPKCEKKQYSYGEEKLESFVPETLVGKISVPRLHARFKCPAFEPRQGVTAGFTAKVGIYGPKGVPAFIPWTW